jgi:hypothetical protein
VLAKRKPWKTDYRLRLLTLTGTRTRHVQHKPTPLPRIMADSTDVQNSPSSSTDSLSSLAQGTRASPPAFNRKDSCTHVFPSRSASTGFTALSDGVNTSRDGHHKRTGSNVKPTFLATPFEDINRLFSGLDWILEVASQSNKSK